MNTEIQEIINKNLPQQVGETLRAYLLKAEEDAKKVISLQEVIAGHEETIAEQREQLDQYKQFDDRNSKLDERKEVLDKMEHDLDLRILTQKFESEKDKSEFVKSVALGLVRNTEFRKTMSNTQNESGHIDDRGAWRDGASSYSSSDETMSAS